MFEKNKLLEFLLVLIFRRSFNFTFSGRAHSIGGCWAEKKQRKEKQMCTLHFFKDRNFQKKFWRTVSTLKTKKKKTVLTIHDDCHILILNDNLANNFS